MPRLHKGAVWRVAGLALHLVVSLPNQISIRGHTDSLPYGDPRGMNNWMLSSSRAEATRRVLADSGIPNARFAKIEGVADRDPFIARDIYDPRNRRMSVILAWSASGGPSETAAPGEAPGGKRADAQAQRLSRTLAAMDMGGTELPAGAVPINTAPAGKTGAAPGKGER